MAWMPIALAADKVLAYDPPPSDSRRRLTRNEQARLNRAHRWTDAPLLVKTETGVTVRDGHSMPAHLRRYYAQTTMSGQARKRPHRGPQGIRGGQRGNGAAADGRVHGLAPADNTRGW